MNWKKVENETGYPCYIDDRTGKEQYDHPEFQRIMDSLREFDDIKYSAYRIAFKVYILQRELRVPPLRISSGVFARHQLSLSENSLSLDTTELEAVLADIYFAAEKEGLFNGNVDLAVDLMINLLLNVYDKERKEPIRVLAAKTLLIVLSEESAADKWLALANCCADHNGCVSPKRLAVLLTHLVALPQFLGTSCDQIQEDVDACFDKSGGMLGMGSRAVGAWGAAGSGCGRWIAALQRLAASRVSARASAACAACAKPLIQVLKFKCSKCMDTYFCEKCYLYGKDMTSATGHKKSHLVHEIIDGQTKPSECLSFIKGMRRFFFCTKTKKKRITKSSKKTIDKPEAKNKDSRPAIFTSTVGKASGSNASNNPAVMLQDIIMQLEMQNKALKEISCESQEAKECNDEGLRAKVVAHWDHISTQIDRLKVLKENLTAGSQNTATEVTNADKIDRPQAFDLFSPIAVEEKQPKITENLKNQPRVLSLDSGNFSVASKHDSQNLLTVSGDALKPVVIHATSDSISAVSMDDISGWHNETESLASKTCRKPNSKTQAADTTCQSISAAEKQYAADIRSVATSNEKMRELNAELDTVLDRLQQILTTNFAVDDSCFDNTQLRETANEMEGLLGTLIRGVEERATLNATKGLV